MSIFQLKTSWEPCGDQPKAIQHLTQAFEEKKPYQTLLGVTGSGKTFVMANVIRNLELPTLIISHNKTLAAQLYSEFKRFFPENAVEYFVSYYDFYQPEAYIPQRDIYIEKEASINEQLDRLRLSATSSLLSRKDTIIVSSVSCIYGLGDPDDYKAMVLPLEQGQEIERERLFLSLVEMQYARNDIEFSRGYFRARGDVIEIFPSYESSAAIRIEMFGDEIEHIHYIHPTSKEILKQVSSVVIYPAKHFVMPQDKIERAVNSIQEELKVRLEQLQTEGKLLEANRLESRTLYDIEMLKEVGYCSGIENYSRHFSGRNPGERPFCLLDYFPKDYLVIVDESHVTIPQIRGMYRGDKARKENLVNYGFRLPSALDNRPLMFEEWISINKQTLFVSATPGIYELECTQNEIVEQLIRPTGLIDPEVEVKPTEGQVVDLIEQILKRSQKDERVLVTTLTKSLSEDLTEHLQNAGIKVAYLHCDIDAFERVDILQDLRKGVYDAVIGVNLLREGLDLPEVSLVAILDADRQGFLRSETSLIQTMGRAARNENSHVILYADEITPAMDNAMKETRRRREIQMEYNKKHGIVPKTVKKDILEGIEGIRDENQEVEWMVYESNSEYSHEGMINTLKQQMEEAASTLNFELAARLRDKIYQLQGGDEKSAPKGKAKRTRRRKHKV